MSVEITNKPTILKDANSDQIKHFDENFEYIYNRIYDPDSKSTSFYALFYKNKDSQRWKVKPGLLSSRYTIVPTKYLLDQIQKNIDNQIHIQKRFNFDTFSYAIFEIDNFSFLNEINNKEEVKNIIKFKLLTDIDMQNLSYVDKISFTLSNSFGGEKNVNISASIDSFFTYKDENFIMKNIFILGNYDFVFKHYNLLDLTISKLLDIKQNIQNNVNKLKNIKIDKEITEKICEKLTKKQNNIFINMLNMLPDNLKNLYFVTYILTNLFNETQLIHDSRVMTLKNFVNEYIEI